VLNIVYDEKINVNLGNQHIFRKQWIKVQTIWPQEKRNYFIIPCSRVPKCL